MIFIDWIPQMTLLKHYQPKREFPFYFLWKQNEGGIPSKQGTWVHPQIAIHLAQWLSPQFAVKVSQWVFDWVSLGKPAKIESSRSIKPPLNLDNMLNAGISLQTTVIEVTHTKQGDVIYVNKLQSSDSVIIKEDSTVSTKPAWIQIVEAFFTEIEHGNIPAEMRQNMLISNEIISTKKDQQISHRCLFFRISNLMTFFRKDPRFFDLLNTCVVRTAKDLLSLFKKANILAFAAKEKEKGIPINPQTSSRTRRVSHLVAMDLVILEQDYRIIIAKAKGIARI